MIEWIENFRESECTQRQSILLDALGWHAVSDERQLACPVASMSCVYSYLSASAGAMRPACHAGSSAAMVEASSDAAQIAKSSGQGT